MLTRDGIGLTVEAEHRTTHDPVLLRLVPLAMTDITAAAAPAADDAGRPNHPNIATILETGTGRDFHYTAMERLEGEPLDRWVSVHGPLPPEAALRIARQVVLALGAGAFHGLSHAAVQPANIMLVPGVNDEGEWPFIKLLGFGPGRLRPAEADAGPEEAARLAAFQYAAPEQLDRGETDFQSAVYSLGCTLWFLLTGHPPFLGSPAAVTAQQMMAEPPVAQLEAMPKGVRELLEKMLAKNPDARPRDPVLLAKEMERHLTRLRGRSWLPGFLGGAAVSAATVPPPEPEPVVADPVASSREARAFRNLLQPAGYAVAALALIVLASLAWPAFQRALENRQARQEAELIGEPVGVPTPGVGAAGGTIVTTASPEPMQEVSPAATASPVLADTESSPAAVVEETTTPAPAVSPTEQVVAAATPAPVEAEPPAEGPEEGDLTAESTTEIPSDDTTSGADEPPKAVASSQPSRVSREREHSPVEAENDSAEQSPGTHPRP